MSARRTAHAQKGSEPLIHHGDKKGFVHQELAAESVAHLSKTTFLESVKHININSPVA